MRFKEFLAEGDHKRDISIEKAFELIKANCKGALENIDTPLWRGTKKSTEEAYFIHGDAEGTTGRESANTTNHYTMLMDKFLPYYGYPQRGKSIIFASHENSEYASSFGKLYAIFPYDNEAIGVCQKYDLWQTDPFDIGNFGERKSLSSWNSFWHANRLSSESWEAFERGVRELMEDQGNRGRSFLKWFGPPEKIRTLFEHAYGPENLQLELTNGENIHDYTGEHELWMSGKCIALDAKVYRNHLNELRNLR